MKIGFVGAGKAGCSLGKYFSGNVGKADILVTGYYSLIEEEARWAATFTKSQCFHSVEDVIVASDTIILSTPDGAIKKVWETIDKDKIKGKIFCHLSGSLSSDVFSGIEGYGGYPISIHPMFAFSDKESVYRQLKEVSFTLEGHPYAVFMWSEVLQVLGNEILEISKDVKQKYHAAASILSNHVIAVLNTGYKLLEECGFTPEEARRFSRVLVQNNVEHVIDVGSTAALTGPIERGDVETVEKHLEVINADNALVYRTCGQELVRLAECKNPERNYEEIKKTLNKKGEKVRRQNEEYSINI